MLEVLLLLGCLLMLLLVVLLLDGLEVAFLPIIAGMSNLLNFMN